jgi:hypothetical protein
MTAQKGGPEAMQIRRTSILKKMVRQQSQTDLPISASAQSHSLLLDRGYMEIRTMISATEAI